MSGFPIPINERERLAELQKLRFDEWGGSSALKALCAVTANVLRTPIAHVSLVDGREQVFAGKIGLDAERTSREAAFCAHTIMEPRPFIIEDASKDYRFKCNPLVTGKPSIQSYIGIPLETTPGLRIGALCAADTKPRIFSDRDVETLTGLGQIVVSIIKSHHMTLELDDQLQSAIALQSDMLPHPARIAHIQSHCPLNVSSYYQARDGIGGDIWGIDVISPQRIMLYVADFTGHGVAAALNTARFHSFVHMMWEHTGKPAQLLKRLNKRLHEVLPIGHFATMFCAAIDFVEETVEYASAGAPPQLYSASAHAPFELITVPGLPLGIEGNAAYESGIVPFSEGGSLILFSDGLIETPKPPRSIFTSASLTEVLNKTANGENASEICHGIISELFAGPAMKANDDITLIVAKHTGRIMETVDYNI